MGHMSDLLIRKTENVIGELIYDGFLSNESADLYFNKIQEFIMDSGDMINDSPKYIADEFKKHCYGRKPKNRQTRLVYPENNEVLP
jgi:hypothetical protein